MTDLPPEILGLPDLNGHVPGTVSAPEIGTVETDFSNIPEEPTRDPGSIIDAELSSPLFEEDKPPAKKAPKSTAPTVNEWQDFISRILIRHATDFYLSYAFRGIDDSLLSDRDVDRIRLSKEERNRIAEPIAEFTQKTGLGKKYGRTVISAAGSFESLVTLGMWVSRVNRIARKYRPKTVPNKGGKNVDSRSDHGQGPGDDGEQRIVIIPGRG